MSKSIRLTPIQWEKLKNRLTNDYSPSVMLIRTKMIQVLGFVNRDHQEWITEGVVKGHDYGRYRHTVHLDFYNEPKRTMFLLKYSEYLDKTGKNALD